MAKKQRGASLSKQRTRGQLASQGEPQKNASKTLNRHVMPVTQVIKSPDTKLIDSNKLQSVNNNYSRFINHVKSEKKITKKAGEDRGMAASSQNVGSRVITTSATISNHTSQLAAQNHSTQQATIY